MPMGRPGENPLIQVTNGVAASRARTAETCHGCAPMMSLSTVPICVEPGPQRGKPRFGFWKMRFSVDLFFFFSLSSREILMCGYGAFAGNVAL